MRPIAGSFVAQLSEGVALRKILSADAMVVLLNGVMPQAMPFCCAQQITPLLNSVDRDGVAGATGGGGRSGVRF